MKRRDFIKIGIGTAVAGAVAMNEAESQTAIKPVGGASKISGEMPTETISGWDWSVKFRSVTTSIMRETYDLFFNDRQRNHRPEDFLNYLLSGTDLPRCEKVDGIETSDYCGFSEIKFTGVVFTSNTKYHSEHRFAGFEHTGFCLSSPDSKSGMYLTFSEEAF